METAVRKGTRLDYNPPKQKHLQTLIKLTFQSPGNAASIVDLLEKRLRENSWIIIFKVLIIIHTLMKAGDGDKVISYIETRPSALDTSKLREKSSGVVHIQNIYLYTAYLEQKVVAYRNSRIDFVKNTLSNKEGRLRRLSIKNGLLKETIILQKQINTLLKCNFILDDVDNNISLYAFKLLIEDLLILFQVMNESIVNILEHYFAMDKSDARTSLEIYKRFAKQTEDTIAFLNKARRLQHDLNITIPEVKHAPLSLAAALQEYLDDKKIEDTDIQENQVNTVKPLEQPKELTDFFQSLENEKVNVFYNPIIMQQPQHAIFTSPVSTTTTTTINTNPFRVTPQQSVSSLLPTNSQTNNNPFRTNTVPQMSLSSPTTLYQNSNNDLFSSFNNNNNNNPFTAMNSTVLPPTLLVATPSSNNNHNPFSSYPTPKQQQLQTWSNNTIF